MDALEALSSEHRLIESVLDALDAYVAGDRAAAEDLPRFVEFFRDYADKKHHAKEEDILFEAMCNNGFPRGAGPVAVMLHEHNQGREWVDKLAAGQDVTASAHGFTSLLRPHIQKEDNVLYQMARTRLPPQVLAQVNEQCAARDREHAERGETARLEALAAELTQRYG